VLEKFYSFTFIAKLQADKIYSALYSGFLGVPKSTNMNNNGGGYVTRHYFFYELHFCALE